MKKIRVINMKGSSGREVPNQFIIQTNDGLYFQSYHSIIAFKKYGGPVYLDKDKWDYSVTTGKYRNIFLRENKRETEQKIRNGVYKLVDLN